MVKTVDKNSSKESTKFIEKSSSEKLLNYLERKNIYAIDIKPLPSFFQYIYNNVSISKITDEDILFLFETLSSSMKSGISITDTLEDIAYEIKKPTFKYVLNEIIDYLEEGYTFIDACKKHPTVFNDHIISLLEIGYESGKFQLVLEDIVGTLRSEYELSKNLKQAMIYPTIALLVIFGVFTFWGIYVVPKVVTSLGASGLELPAITIALSTFFSMVYENWILVVSGIVVTILLVFTIFKVCKKCREKVSALFSKLPFISTMVQEYNMVLISKYLSLILSTGKTLSFGLELLSNTLSNIAYKEELKRIMHDIYNGKKLSETIEESEYFSRMMYRAILAGEYSGSLENELKQLGKTYEAKLTDKTKTITKVIEPVVTVLLGLMVIVLILSFLSPIYGLILEI